MCGNAVQNREFCLSMSVSIGRKDGLCSSFETVTVRILARVS